MPDQSEVEPAQPEPAQPEPAPSEPAPSEPVLPELEIRKLELERYKARLDYRKFVLASVFAAITIAAIPPLFQLATALLEYTKSQAQLRIDQQNREAERLAKQEEFRETYVKEFLVNALNQDIELRIRFSEYFAFVSAESFREGWTRYHDNLVKHRDEIRQQINQLEAEWRRLKENPVPDDTRVDYVTRTLTWLYNEVGYVERNRSVTANPRVPSREIPSGQLCLLMVGISALNEKYGGHLRNMYAKEDAHDLATALLTTQNKAYTQISPVFLGDSTASKVAILDGLSTVRRLMTRGTGSDLTVIYLSSYIAQIDDRLYLLPYDVDARDDTRIKATAISFEDLRDELRALSNSGQILVLIDIAILGAYRFNSDRLRTGLSGPNISVFTSVTDNEVGVENEEWHHSAFAKALLEALSDPNADTDRTGIIRTAELAEYISRRVVALTDGRQHPGIEIRFDRPLFSISQATSSTTSR